MSFWFLSAASSVLCSSCEESLFSSGCSCAGVDPSLSLLATEFAVQRRATSCSPPFFERISSSTPSPFLLRKLSRLQSSRKLADLVMIFEDTQPMA
ncbi:uncharacterized protein M6B38_109605 [Iris pallida]|uniref:Secreted protein n=1 Tax=Iris pallida TaxID=29817 RepID=A0AAX6E8T7_IRIPA|nr:Uncharacterized protein M6B38_208950 [Iris pallida]KAJ6800405.1 uncharacterized protein M6B38_109605 [Iris pallida]